MNSFWRKPYFLSSFVAFSVFNIILFGAIYFFHNSVAFSAVSYKVNAHHFFTDPRIDGGNFSFLRSLGVFDAQWYLKIASTGYPSHPTVATNDKRVMDGLTYAFFPLYPLIITTGNLIVRNVELAAFLIAIVLLVVDFILLYRLVSERYGEGTAVKTATLLFLFPFAIFYRSYYTEGLFLFLLLLFAYGLRRKRPLLSAAALGLLTVTNARGVLLYAYFFFWLRSEKKPGKRFLALALSTIPPILWLIFCYMQTGNPFYFIGVRTVLDGSMGTRLIGNIWRMVNIASLPLYGFHLSRMDTFFMLLQGLLIIVSRKKIEKEWWWIWLLLYIPPVISKDTTSFSRYQATFFPFFVYLARAADRKWFAAGAVVFGCILIYVSLLFVNWWWIG